MKMQPHIIKRIAKNALISLVIYALPLLVMFLVFYIRGERPWQKQKVEKVTSVTGQK